MAAKEDVDARQRRQVYVVCAKQTTMAGQDEKPRSPRQPPQKTCQIVGDMVDRGIVAAFELPVFAHDFS